MGASSPLPPTYLRPEDPDHCRGLLDPWVVSTFRRRGLAWKWIRARDAAHWRFKIVKRMALSRYSPGVRPVSAYRTEAHIERTYDRTWASVGWPRPRDTTLGLTPAEWAGEGILLTKGGLNQMECERLMAAIAVIEPKNVLEVGAGMGTNLFAMAAAFPEIAFTGIELTEQGVGRAKSVQCREELPDVLAAWNPMPVKDRKAHRRIEFVHGDATAMPFAGDSFDLVFSRLALEQMELARDAALAEIVRVASGAFLCVEPFADFNRDPHRRLAHRAKNYLSLRVADLPEHGLEPVATFSDWPQKLHGGAGLVHCDPR